MLKNMVVAIQRWLIRVTLVVLLVNYLNYELMVSDYEPMVGNIQ